MTATSKNGSGKRIRYRSRNDIIAELLKIALDGSNKTTLMYHGYLSYAQLQDYLQFLVEKGLLEFESKNKKYHTTKKGRDFLDVYEKTRI